MRVDALMKVRQAGGGASIIAESSKDALVSGEGVELFSFEYCIERSPTRTTSENNLRDMALMEKFGLKASPLGQGVVSKLAGELQHLPLAVLKVWDINSPVLFEWSTKKDELLDVDIIVRLPGEADGQNVQQVTEFTIELKNAYISTMSLVGDFAAQPCLEGAAVFPLNSVSTLAQGPMERIEFRYQSAEWKWGDSSTTGVQYAVRDQSASS